MTAEFKSNCCNAEIKIVPGIPDEGSEHYEEYYGCSECARQCEPKGIKTMKAKFGSTCCNAPVRIAGSPDFAESGDDSVCTNYHECTQCKEACDIKPPSHKFKAGDKVKVLENDYHVPQGFVGHVLDDTVKDSLLEYTRLGIDMRDEKPYILPCKFLEKIPTAEAMLQEKLKREANCKKLPEHKT
jgi:hypothetical protein